MGVWGQWAQRPQRQQLGRQQAEASTAAAHGGVFGGMFSPGLPAGYALREPEGANEVPEVKKTFLQELRQSVDSWLEPISKLRDKGITVKVKFEGYMHQPQWTTNTISCMPTRIGY